MINPVSKAKKQSVGILKYDCPTKKVKFLESGKYCENVAVDRPSVSQFEWAGYRYYPVDEEWQRKACYLPGIQFMHPFL